MSNYSRYDDEFRAAKKRGDHKRASEWKSKRDALTAKLDEAIETLK
jgi:hypothetical protein